MKILVVVDMQNDFIDGALGTPEAQAIVPNVINKINKYKAERNSIVYTADTHRADYLNTIEGNKLPVPHCIKGTDGWKIPDKILQDGKILEKQTFGCTTLHDYIRTNFYDIESIEVIGLCTDICVISNVMLLKAYFPNTPIIVDSACCAGVTPESHIRALEAMKMCHIEVV